MMMTILCSLGGVGVSDSSPSPISDFACMRKQNKQQHISSGHAYNCQARMLILNVLKYHMDLNQGKAHAEKINTFEQTAVICGVSKGSVQSIHKETPEAPVLTTPGKKPKKRISVDSLMVDTIRRIIHSYYKANQNQPFSIDELLVRVRQEMSFPYGKGTLLTIVCIITIIHHTVSCHEIGPAHQSCISASNLNGPSAKPKRSRV